MNFTNKSTCGVQLESVLEVEVRMSSEICRIVSQ